MASKRTANHVPSATLNIADHTRTIASRRSDRTGPLGGLVRSAALRRTFRLLAYAALAALIGALLLVATATLPVLLGYHTYNVEGSSMAPSLQLGSAVVTHPTGPRALKVGDIIVRPGSGGTPPVLHRVVDVTVGADGERLFVTQGDRNQTRDPKPVAFDGSGDKVVYSVPYAGYILSFAESSLGRLVLIGIPLVLLVAIFSRDKWSSGRKETGSTSGRSDSDSSGAPPDAPNEEWREAATILRELEKPSHGAGWLLLMPLAIAVGLMFAGPSRWNEGDRAR
ncbi:MAG: signal peptidase I [Dehalococcoidia bacterium]